MPLHPTCCPACARPVAMARTKCLYCGAPLPAVVLEEASRAVRNVLETRSLQALMASDPSRARPSRRYVVVETDAVPVEALAFGCAVSLWEAGQWRAASKYRLLKISREPPEGDFETGLRARGLQPLIVTEEQVARARTPLVLETLDLSEDPIRGTVREEAESEAQIRELVEDELSLVVSAPIKQEKVGEQAKHLRSSRRLEEAWLVHLHFKNEPRPWEIDPRRTAYKGPGLASAHMTTLELVRRFADRIPCDEGFKKLVPALAPALVPPDHLSSLAPDRKKRDREAKAVFLDNVAQFREYSAWRAAIERLL